MNPHDRLLGHLVDDALDAEDRAHAEGCPGCRPLLPGAREPSARAAGGASLERIHAASLATLRESPVRPWQRDAWVLATVDAAIAIAASFLLGFENWRSPLADQRALAVSGALLFVALTAGAFLALAPDRRRRAVPLALIALVPLLIVAVGNGRHTARGMATAMPCAVTVLFTAVVPLAVGLALLRGMALDLRRAAAVAVTGAATGLFALHWHCTDGSAPHLLGFHLLPWLLVVAGAVALRSMLPTRSHVP